MAITNTYQLVLQLPPCLRYYTTKDDLNTHQCKHTLSIQHSQLRLAKSRSVTQSTNPATTCHQNAPVSAAVLLPYQNNLISQRMLLYAV